MSRSRLAPESLKRVSNLIPGILAGSVPDSDLEERNLGPPIALTTSYSFGVNVDEKSDTISSGYTRIYEDLRSTFLWRKKREEREIFLQRWSSSNRDEESFEDIDDDSAIDHKSLYHSSWWLAIFIWATIHPRSIRPSFKQYLTSRAPCSA